MRILLITSVARTIDAFFGDWLDVWEDVATVATAANGIPQRDHTHFDIPSLRQRPSPALVRAAVELRATLRTFQPDAIVTNTATASLLSRLLPRRCKLIYFCHGLHWDSPEYRNLPFRIVEAGLLRRSDGVICINRDDRDWFLGQGYDEARLKYLTAGVGVDLEYWRSPAPVLPPRSVSMEIVWVGELTPRKRPFMAVDVLERLASSGRQARLHILGVGGLYDSLNCEIRRRGLQEDVILHGRVDPRPFLQAYDLLLHTATWEGLPRAVLEAATTGTPVVAVDAKGTRDVPGVVLSAPDAAALSRAVVDSISSGKSGSELGSDYEARRAASAALDFIVGLPP